MTIHKTAKLGGTASNVTVAKVGVRPLRAPGAASSLISRHPTNTPMHPLARPHDDDVSRSDPYKLPSG